MGHLGTRPRIWSVTLEGKTCPPRPNSGCDGRSTGPTWTRKHIFYFSFVRTHKTCHVLFYLKIISPFDDASVGASVWVSLDFTKNQENKNELWINLCKKICHLLMMVRFWHQSFDLEILLLKIKKN